MLVVATSVTACGADMDLPVDESIEGEVDSLMYSPEGPSTQSVILPNSLDPAALQPSDLGVHPLSIAGMSTATATLVKGPGGVLTRKLLRYAVGCALGPQTSFNFSWVDATGTTHSETYTGFAGIAPAWTDRALTVPEQEWVSACLAARTNWYGEAVRISMRAALPEFNTTNDGEESTFSYREGAFWGNLFSATPFLRACYDADNVEHSRLRHRDCATGHVENGTVLQCGIIAITGSCQQTCLAPTEGGYYPSCVVASGGVSGQEPAHRVISVFVH